VAVERLQLFHRAGPPAVTHGICEECYQSALGMLTQS
jgi:hypothetical protein